MSYAVYCLYSDASKRTYVGQPENLQSRLERHAAGMVLSTRAYHPGRLVYVEVYDTRAEAMKRERWFKTGVGRKCLKRFVPCAGRLLHPPEADARKGL